VSETIQSAADPLRISDMVPLRRMLGTDSVVIRVNPDGSFTPFERMPSLFFERPIRRILAADAPDQFDKACAQAIEERRPVAFRPAASSSDEVMINPILDDAGSLCRFLVCWVRWTDTVGSSSPSLAWGDLELGDVVTRYRLRSDRGSDVVEAASWWALRSGELLELWPHHTHVSAMGLGHAVMEALIIDAVEAAAVHGGGPAVRIAVPSADMLSGLVPVFHGAAQASGVDLARIVVAIDVELAVDPDLLPIVVHLRTLGMRIDIVGLDALTATLHTVSDTSSHSLELAPPSSVVAGPWAASFAAAIGHAT
jgi:hypothetical protein